MLNWIPHSLNPSQFTQAQQPGANSLLLETAGAALYYVTEAEIGSHGEDNSAIWIQKSTDAGKTWTRVYDGPILTDTFCVVLCGSVICIFGDNGSTSDNDLWVFRFDTGSDSMLDTGTDLGQVFTTSGGICCAQFNNGTVGLLWGGAGAGREKFTAIYTPGSNSLSSLVDTGVNPQFVYVAAHDPATDLAVFFVQDVTNPNQVNAFTLTHLNVQSAIVIAFTSLNLTTLGLVNFAIAAPPVIDKSGNVVIGFMNPAEPDPEGSDGPSSLQVVRSPVAALNFGAAETVVTFASNPLIWTNSLDWFAATLAVDKAGLLYAFYAVNAGFLDNAASQTQLAFSTSSVVGTWIAAAAPVFSIPAPSSSLAAYPLQLANGSGIGLIAGYVNPVLFGSDEYSALTVLYLGPGSSFSATCSTSLATVGTPYNSPIVPSGGSPPFTFALFGAQPLPPGLALNPLTGAIAGTPTQAGTFPYSVTITDADNVSQVIDCSITVSPVQYAPTVYVIPFQTKDPCCECPQLVTCPQCGGDGKQYVAGKG